MRIEVKTDSNFKQEVFVDNICPNCSKPTNPQVVSQGYNEIMPGKDSIYVTLRCLGCYHYWVEEFVRELDRGGFYDTTHIKVKTQLPSDIPISNDLELISPVGKEIYVQSLKAEQEHLDLIAGIGYRKALEFFVKDFSILTNPDKKEKITNMLLKQVIEDEDLKTFALASTYIGNDEGHYYRKNPDKNLADLKKYIHGVIYYLEKRLIFLDAQELVNRSTKS
ncbi:DUF4145 domain-containing protein [Streptococcus pneumoniae]|uniref:DUF4145 domain-containing protein n=1 Tax=Streptococcus pneumoniae TaxID=1313 RepID=UPI000F637F95|nr:DUF4145 domain-containing protein [Streptococcus pneumoniae]MDS2363623.1 DUF4145 domain-containing protein [Streptococcus pneumoniae]MDS2440221.1 DUF4145 domain-containing protein [Streptococcus pneumoniae]MDS2470639.1 DUF4145 domain-containing protein [Streptococcus pneumoniae]MDS2548892.1 DUF4145 domain-containing protein [Streptococcus pneumoniae]MDS2655279.1 DUF4145 domain-containing protein [Streptococcus pneumoniae]